MTPRHKQRESQLGFLHHEPPVQSAHWRPGQGRLRKGMVWTLAVGSGQAEPPGHGLLGHQEDISRQFLKDP